MAEEKRFTMNNNWLFDSLSRSVYDIDFMYSWTYDKTFKRTYVNFKDGNTVDFSDCIHTGQTLSDLITFYLFK